MTGFPTAAMRSQHSLERRCIMLPGGPAAKAAELKGIGLGNLWWTCGRRQLVVRALQDDVALTSQRRSTSFTWFDHALCNAGC